MRYFSPVTIFLIATVSLAGTLVDDSLVFAQSATDSALTADTAEVDHAAPGVSPAGPAHVPTPGAEAASDQAARLAQSDGDIEASAFGEAADMDGEGEEDAADAAVPAVTESSEEPDSGIDVTGAVRFSYRVLTWADEESNRERLGDVAFDTFILGAKGHYGPFQVSGAYRFLQGYHFLHHGYLGYSPTDDVQIDFGIHQVPFGILRFASHSWFFNMTYYLGFEDDYDTGIRVKWQSGDFDLRVAFYKNSEGNFTGNSIGSTRYSYDVVNTSVEELGYAGLMSDQTNTEANQFNIRTAYNLRHGDLGNSILGLSGQVGGLYNNTSEKYGWHWAAAAHANSTLGAFNIHLQALAYAFNPDNPELMGVTQENDDFIVMGAYDAPYLVADAGYLFSFNIAHTFQLTGAGPISSVQVYNNYSVLLKDNSDYPATHLNDVGALVVAGPIYTYFDLVYGRHHPWLGPGAGYGTGLHTGRTEDDGSRDNDWHGRFNVNVGYYF